MAHLPVKNLRKESNVLIAKKMFLKAFIVFFVYSVLMLTLSCAQETSSEERADESEATHEIKSDEIEAEIDAGGHVEGIVTSVNALFGSITVKDVDEDGTIYRIGVKESTTFFGASSLSDINVGDKVSVDYYNLGGNRTAENITLEEKAYKEEPPEKLEKVLVD